MPDPTKEKQLEIFNQINATLPLWQELILHIPCFFQQNNQKENPSIIAIKAYQKIIQDNLDKKKDLQPIEHFLKSTIAMYEHTFMSKLPLLLQKFCDLPVAVQRVVNKLLESINKSHPDLTLSPWATENGKIETVKSLLNNEEITINDKNNRNAYALYLTAQGRHNGNSACQIGIYSEHNEIETPSYNKPTKNGYDKNIAHVTSSLVAAISSEEISTDNNPPSPSLHESSNYWNRHPKCINLPAVSSFAQLL